MPFLPFAVLGGITGFGAFTLGRSAQERRDTEASASQALTKPAISSEEPIGRSLSIDHIRLEFWGYALLGLINSEAGQRLTDQNQGPAQTTRRRYGLCNAIRTYSG